MDAWPAQSRLGSSIVEATVDDEETTTSVVVAAVAAVSDVPTTKLPPLYDAVDPDALDALFPGGVTDGNVTFPYNGYVVVVTADERVSVYDGEAS